MLLLDVYYWVGKAKEYTMERRGSPVSCPVCTLYMREGVTLQTHLNTHPKEQVIAALVKISAGELRYKLASACERSLSAKISSQELPAHGRSTSSVSAQFPQPSSSHFTTAITYQHFLSSNGVPQYVPMPAVLSDTGTSPASANQAAFMQMVYNPYMMHQQQQQMQLLNSISPPPHQQSYIRHVLSPSPGLFSPSNINPQAVELSPASLTINIPFSTDNIVTGIPGSSEPQTFQTTQTSNTHICSLKSPLSNASVASTSGISFSAASNRVIESSLMVISEKEQNTSAKVLVRSVPEAHQSPSSHAECSSTDTTVPDVRDEEQQTEGSCFTNDSSRESYDIGGDDTATITCVAPCRSGKDETTQTINSYDDIGVVQKLTGPSGFEKNKSESDSDSESEKEENEDVTKPENVDGTENGNGTENDNGTENVNEMENISEAENISETEDVEPENANDNENAESENETDNQNKLCTVPKEKAEPFSLLTTDIQLMCERGSVSNTAGESLMLAEDTNNENAEFPSNASSSTSNIVSDMIQISGLVRNALEIQPPVLCAENDDEYMSSKYQEQRSNSDVCPENVQEKSGTCSAQGGNSELSNFVNSEPVDAYTIINIDGMHIAVPEGLVQPSSSLIITPDETTGVVETLQSTEQCEASFSNEPVLNIHTDETMPPKGELSEQESVGGNDSFMWAQAFNEASTPCDLLARESWEASDGSDVDVPADNDSLPSEHNQERMCALPLKLQLKQRLKEPKVYTCAVCNQNFNCPKERRVHQSTAHGSIGESSNGETSMETDEKQCLTSTVNVRENEHCTASENSSITEPVIEGEEATGLKDDSDESTDIEISEAETAKQRSSVHGYLCSKCPEMFPSLKLRAAHESEIHQITKEVNKVCKTCNKIFENYLSFREHLQIHPLECLHCGKCFNRRQNLDLHLRRHLDIKPHKCTLCDKAFVTKQKLAEHMNTHTGNCPIKCPMCDETFRRYSNLIQHKNRHHLKKKKKIKDFICRCGEIFHSRKKLEWHKETHDINPKRCKYCTERFVHVSSLTRHIRKAHDCRYIPEGGRTSENVECTICGFVFLKGSLQVHMRNHRGERPFSCHECGKGFTTKWNLQLHRWTHAARSAKPFKCNLCKSAFFRDTDLTAHENSHRKVKPYTCNHCGSRFIRKYNCLRHVREHETGKTFKCSVCNKTFHRSYYLKEHLRVHSGVRPFSCHICGKTSTTKSNHNKHVKIHHAREQVNTEG